MTVVMCLAGWGVSRADETHRHERADARLIGGQPLFTWESLPESRLRRTIAELEPEAQETAEQWLRGFRFPPEDLAPLHVDDLRIASESC